MVRSAITMDYKNGERACTPASDEHQTTLSSERTTRDYSELLTQLSAP